MKKWQWLILLIFLTTSNFFGGYFFTRYFSKNSYRDLHLSELANQNLSLSQILLRQAKEIENSYDEPDFLLSLYIAFDRLTPFTANAVCKEYQNNNYEINDRIVNYLNYSSKLSNDQISTLSGFLLLKCI